MSDWFWWRCAREAWHGSIALANAWGPVLGAFVLIWLGANLTAPQTIGEGIALTVICAAIAWVIFFVGRLLFVAPATLYRVATQKIDQLNRLVEPKIELVFDASRCVVEQTASVSFVHAFAYNRSGLPIEDCEAVLLTVTRNGDSVGYLSRKNLSWSQPLDGTIEKYGKIRLADGEDEHRVDVFAAGHMHGRPFIRLRIAEQANQYGEPGIYQLRMYVSGRNAPRAEITLEVDLPDDPASKPTVKSL